MTEDTARVRLPETRTPVLLIGISEWAEAEDVVSGLAQATITGISDENVTIRKTTGGQGEYVACLNLSLRDAITLAEKKVVTVELTRCRVKLLERSQPTCFRCQVRGHLVIECRNKSKPRRYFKCRTPGHIANECHSVPRSCNSTAAVSADLRPA